MLRGNEPFGMVLRWVCDQPASLPCPCMVHACCALAPPTMLMFAPAVPADQTTEAPVPLEVNWPGQVSCRSVRVGFAAKEALVGACWRVSASEMERERAVLPAGQLATARSPCYLRRSPTR